MVICGSRKVAHRVSYELHHGPIDAENLICHSCDNPSCVNPRHLFQGSSRDNRLDCTGKWRHAYGAKSPNAVLSEDDVLAIKMSLKEEGVNQRDIARKYGVTPALICHIRKGRAWRHV